MTCKTCNLKDLSELFFKFEYSCVFIFVDRNTAMVAFDCDFFALLEKTHYHFMIPLMAGQTTWLKYYSGRFPGLEYRKLFCKMIQRSSGQKVRR